MLRISQSQVSLELSAKHAVMDGLQRSQSAAGLAARCVALRPTQEQNVLLWSNNRRQDCLVLQRALDHF